mmetsp:Transcript_51389/g.142190  ORF Transcript_51389/g.142190 Transcript_51389/m.142190 type:complete len:398 (-) Transcript_51389:1222-2415(-)
MQLLCYEPTGFTATGPLQPEAERRTRSSGLAQKLQQDKPPTLACVLRHRHMVGGPPCAEPLPPAKIAVSVQLRNPPGAPRRPAAPLSAFERLISRVRAHTQHTRAGSDCACPLTHRYLAPAAADLLLLLASSSSSSSSSWRPWWCPICISSSAPLSSSTEMRPSASQSICSSSRRSVASSGFLEGSMRSIACRISSCDMTPSPSRSIARKAWPMSPSARSSSVRSSASIRVTRESSIAISRELLVASSMSGRLRCRTSSSSRISSRSAAHAVGADMVCTASTRFSICSRLSCSAASGAAVALSATSSAALMSLATICLAWRSSSTRASSRRSASSASLGVGSACDSADSTVSAVIDDSAACAAAMSMASFCCRACCCSACCSRSCAKRSMFIRMSSE